MSVVALSTTVKSAVDGNTYASSSQTYETTLNLNDDFDAGDTIRVAALSTAGIQVLDQYGHKIGYVAAGQSASFTNFGTDLWAMSPGVTAVPATYAADLATTAAQDAVTGNFAFDTAAQADGLIARVNSILAALRGAGIMKAE